MPSDLTPLGKKEWETRKGRIGEKMGEFAELHRKTIREMLPDIKAIKEKELWRHGNYESFQDFCQRCVGVTKQHIYKLLSEDDLIRKVLEIKDGESSYLTPPHQSLPPKEELPAPAIEPPKSAPKPRKEPPMKPVKAREIESVTVPHGMEEAVENFKEGRVSAPVDFAKYLPSAPASKPEPRHCPHCGRDIE